MPRCYICNLSSDFEVNPEARRNTQFAWDRKENGFICGSCSSVVAETLFELGEDDDGIADLEEFTLLEIDGMEGTKRGDRGIG